MQPINNQEAIAMSQPRTSLSNSFTLACMQYTHAGMQVHALSSVQNTHKHTHSSRHRSASLPSRHYKYSKEGHSNLKSDQVSKVYKEHLMYSLMCKYLQATWVKHRTRGHRNSASNRSLKMVLALELLQKTPLSSHLNDIYFGLLQDVGRYTSKLCETVLTFHNDLPIWSAEVKNSRSEQRWSGAEVETGDFQQGSVSVKKPEDPGYLLLLAAPQTKRGLNTFFPVWLQTMRGFEAVHDSHGNGFWVPTIMCISFLGRGVINDHKAENAKRGRFEALTLAFSRKSRTQQRDNKTKSQQVSYLWHQLAFHQHL